VRRRVGVFFAAAILAALVAGIAPAGASGRAGNGTGSFNAKAYKRTHGYLPLRGVATLEAAKAHAAAIVAAQHPLAGSAPAATGRTPTIGASWGGVNTSSVSPPDANGAIGPNGYVETVNLKVGIYSRTGVRITQANMSALTGHSGDSDPMVIWDPDTQRFYYNVLNVNNATMDWGFSKDSNPTAIPGSFCRYTTSFGYASTNIPDYPKLGQTKDFLMIGVNFYQSLSSQQSTSSDLLWIGKPQGQGVITTCPAAGTFASGKIAGLLNSDGSQAFTPTPAIQTDPSSTGYVLGMSDIECPPTCGTGTVLTVFTVTNGGGVPSVSAPDSITVGSYMSPPSAPQLGTANLLDTLDGRITHSVSGVDPTFGTTTVWVSHTVLGGAGSMINWYEVDPTAGTVVQTGSASSATLYVLNAGISNDRTCDATTCAHGDAMVLGFTTTSSTTHPAIQMVSKIGLAAQSGFVLVKQSTKSDKGFTCSPCRWGDYGGATPDPGASLAAAQGEVWLSNQWTAGGSIFQAGDRTWNWEAQP
jgi:hypothetical protein